ncbi:energy-coupling factor transporter transmembrane component T family protein [Mycoplasma sp. P36-A1]|uniref:energy-coupling factor transporter transmembrane component T family protein n=1 Tax=Mycoplasma sp. P36-A1 TaxID=3252900 RepID=UPI003C2C7889
MLNILNPSIKCLLFLITGLVLAFQSNIYFDLALLSFLIVCLLLSKINYLTFIKTFLIVSIACLSLYFSASNFYALENQSNIAFFNIVTDSKSMYAFELVARTYGYFMLGAAFTLTTDVIDFSYSMQQQLKLPPKFVYGIIACLNMMPLLKNEYFKLKYSFKARGLNPSLLNINLYLPLLVKSVYYSNALALAMESKGFSDDALRSCYHKTNINWYDYLFILLFSLFIIVIRIIL